MNLFVYGTLMSGYHNNTLLRGATKIGDATVKGDMYSLGGFPLVSISGEGTVLGEVYAIDEDHLQNCDYLEGYRPQNRELSFYDRSQVVVTLTDEEEPIEDVFIYHIEDSHYHTEDNFLSHGSWRKHREGTL